MTDIILIRVNCPSQDLAHKLASSCVDGRLVACANIEGPVRSVYRWDGVIQQDEEFVLVLKTRKDQWNAVHELVTALHPSDTPAILATSCVSANPRYEAWLLENTRSN